MQHIEFYGDERQVASCVYCGAATESGDHVPSRVFLDEPYPAHLPRVPACEKCNNGFSLDGEYLACVVECTVCGSTKPEDMARDKIRRALTRSPALAARLEQSLHLAANGSVHFAPERNRVRNVVLKLARGHALFELNEPRRDEPSSLDFQPITITYPQTRTAFDGGAGPVRAIWPEVGSRAMLRILQGHASSSGWIELQPGRYRYCASAGAGITVRFVIHEYLACEVRWD